MLVDIIAGSRPDFLRIASVLETIQHEQRKGAMLGYRFIYTGKDIDINLDKDLFTQLGISRPNVYMDVQEATDGARTAAAIMRYEKMLARNRPDLVMVTGKTTEVMACAITARKTAGIKLASINAGRRINTADDTSEINRRIIDSITDYYFTSSHIANQNLRAEGVTEDRIFFTGNTHIDCVVKTLSHYTKPAFADTYTLQPGRFVVVIVNKPLNTDNHAQLHDILATTTKAAYPMPVIALTSPRTEAIISSLGIQAHNLHMVKRAGYLQLGWLLQNATAVLTDSASIQEECTVLATPTITIYPYTETPETVENGSNKLVQRGVNDIALYIENIQKGKWDKGKTPYLWDGKAADRVVQVLKRI